MAAYALSPLFDVVPSFRFSCQRTPRRYIASRLPRNGINRMTTACLAFAPHIPRRDRHCYTRSRHICWKRRDSDLIDDDETVRSSCWMVILSRATINNRPLIFSFHTCGILTARTDWLRREISRNFVLGLEIIGLGLKAGMSGFSQKFRDG